MSENMNGKELMNEVARGRMPDLEQVRAACLSQTPPPKKSAARRVVQMTAIVLIASLIFGSGVYAVGTVIGNRFDTGGQVEYVFVPTDDPAFIARQETRTVGQQIYINENANITWRVSTDRVFDSRETPRAINEALAGKLFTADGLPFAYDFLVPRESMFMPRVPGMARYEYKTTTQGHILFNADGEELGLVTAWIRQDEIDRIEILTVAEFEAIWGYNDTPEAVAEFLGVDELRLPTAHTERFAPPVFRIEHHSGWVFIRFDAPAEWNYSRMSLRVERVRDDSNAPQPWLFPGATEPREIAGTTVHKMVSETFATGPNTFATLASYYVWEQDGLVYRFYPPINFTAFGSSNIYRFTDAHTYEIIAGIIQ